MSKQGDLSNTSSAGLGDGKNRKVVIVGGGGAGLAAAVAAVQARPDINVTVLEQNAITGGITAVATGVIRACDSRIQKKAGRVGETKQECIKQFLEVGGDLQDAAILDSYVGKSGPVMDWLVSLGCRIELMDVFRFMLMIAPAKEGLSGATGMTEVLYEAARKGGAKFLFEVRATDLITRDGKVVGVKAIAKDGKRLQLDADAVVLADGGFWGAPKGAFDKDIPPHLKDVIIMAEGCFKQGGKGDAVRMAEAVGAELLNMDALAYTAQSYIDAKGNLCPIVGSNTLWSEATAVILNQDLERFLNEDLCYSKETLTDKIAEELVKRHERWIWNIWDDKSRENAYRIRFWIGEGFIDQGFMLVGDTIEELAKKMGVDAVKLKSTIATYNSYFEKGLEKEPQFGRSLKKGKVHPLTKPPFYAMRSGVQACNRRGGVSTDSEARVLTKDKKTIPGLYAAGSSMCAVKWDGLGWLSGTGLTSCAVWGKTAGENAALGR